MRPSLPAALAATLVALLTGCRESAGPVKAGCTSGAAATASITAAGHHAVTLACPAWTFEGELGFPATVGGSIAGQDAIGPFHEVDFAWNDGVARAGSIRAYDSLPVALFTRTNLAAAANGPAFPVLDVLPSLPYRLGFSEAPFAGYTFGLPAPDSPFVFLDDYGEGFLVSAASHFMNAWTTQAPGSLSVGIDPAVTSLPAGFSQSTILVASTSLRSAFAQWGGALLARSGKRPLANDATPELSRFGYWTDNGATYYYNYDSTKGYEGTLYAVRDYFASIGFPLSYLQLDSWWYPKGAAAQWNDHADGEYLYQADPTLFPSGLPAFRASLGLPLLTHARWIDPASPYRSTYAMSNNVSVDPAFWSAVAAELSSAGVITYEQDWLNQMALPDTTVLTDQDRFLGGMASAMAARGLDLQYCMPLPRHFLQSTLYPRVATSRVSGDRFSPDRWHPMLYGSLLASSLGEWPWVDVFLSSEEGNLFLATLSAGPVGVGDALGAASAANLRLAVRPDGVIIKPDTPLLPLDTTIVADASGSGAPVIGAAATRFPGGLTADYVFALPASSVPAPPVRFTGEELGQSGEVYVLDFLSGAGQTLLPGEAFQSAIGSKGYGYWIVAPVGLSGIAFLGDPGKLVSLSSKRFPSLSDDGTVRASLAFAAGEAPLTVRGWASHAPTATGAAGPVSWDPQSGLFELAVASTNRSAAVTLR